MILSFVHDEKNTRAEEGESHSVKKGKITKLMYPEKILRFHPSRILTLHLNHLIALYTEKLSKL